jgi:hypothetical protein
MIPTIDDVLATTGYISEEQLWRYYHLRPHQLRWTPAMLWHQHALWDVKQFRGGHRCRHLALLTEIYLTLAAEHMRVTLPGPRLPFGAVPDAQLIIPGVSRPILLEADTGKETKRQWHEKLDRYRGTGQEYYLWVVAMGRERRLTQLHQWLERRAPLPWQLSSAHAIVLDRSGWQAPSFRADPVSGDSQAQPRVCYILDGRKLTNSEAYDALARGQVAEYAEERRHQTIIYYLRPLTPLKVFPPFGRNSSKTPRILG